MMLNIHRFEIGCPSTLGFNGKLVVLLPVPDFRKGERKRVEELAKEGNSEKDSGRGENLDFEGDPPTKKSKLEIFKGYRGLIGACLMIMWNMVVSLVPDQVEKSLAKSK